MKITAKGLKDKARDFAKNKKITIQEVIQNYIFERFLERLSLSNYNENLILKGGLLLSSMIGIDLRTTMDADYLLKSIKLTENNVKEIISEIININLDDGVKFNFIDTDLIRIQDEYGGYRINLVAILENMRVNISIDIATGDIITPKEIEYYYPCIFEDKKLSIFSYNVETIISEKLLAIVTLKGLNSRTKDFYDLYYIFNKKLDFSSLVAKDAIIATF